MIQEGATNSKSDIEVLAPFMYQRARFLFQDAAGVPVGGGADTSEEEI